LPAELTLRQKLGVPADAERVIVFGQNSHLDVDWQKTFDDYYASWVENILLQARQLLDSDPRAFYSICEMSYLQQHLAVHPEELAPLTSYAASGALRVVGGGMTSPDTLLPETELLARDYLYGIQFAEDTLGAHPHAAWLPDSFGHSATAPDVLRAAGYDAVGFSRVDGAQTLFESIFHPNAPPKPGSTLELLASLGTSDFIWQGAGGGQILAHFMAGTGLYCQGDNIDLQESIVVPGPNTATVDNDPTFTDGRIDGYIAELEPFAVTPYMFVPVGCDFQSPKTPLIQYLDGYNQRRYPETHAWAVAAPFEDFTSLVAFWRDVLPTVTGEVSPYFMGFYGSRADIKRGVRDAARPFFVAEAFATALGAQGQALVSSAEPELAILTRGDHHDFVTGTSADPVMQTEQLPLIAETEQAGENELSSVAAAASQRIAITQGATGRVLAFNASSSARDDVAEFSMPLVNGQPPTIHAVAGGQEVPMELAFAPAATDTTATFHLAFASLMPFSWRTIDLLPGAPTSLQPQVTLALEDQNGAPATGAAITRVVLTNVHVVAQWDASGGVFALTSVVIDGVETLSGPSMLVHDYQDSGGLWRTGNEMSGCSLTPLPSPTAPDTVQVLENGALDVSVAFVSQSSTREASLGVGATGLTLTIVTGAAESTTRTVGFSFVGAQDAPLRTSSAAGFVVRPLQRVYTPTFWPAVAWAEYAGTAILLRQSTGATMSTPGAIELMAARDAREEQCDVLGGTGSDPGTHVIEWRIERTASPAQSEVVAQAFDRPIDLELVTTDQAMTTDLPPELALLSVSGEGIVSALKPATRGDGVVLRVLPMPGPVHVTLGASLVGKAMNVVDLAERDGKDLGVAPQAIDFDRATFGAIASVRLH
jgi:hypothetical protein